MCLHYMGRPIRTVICDLDDTLYEYLPLNDLANERVKRYVMESLSLSERLFDESYLQARKDVKERLKGTASEHNRLLYFQRLMEILKERPVGLAFTLYHIYWDTILENMRLRDGVEDFFNLCKRKGVSIAVCSDLTVQIQHRKILRLGLEQYVDCLVTSEEAGAEKPDPRMFSLVLKKLSASPESSLFIGDSFSKDIVGAADAGMFAVWLSERNDFPEAYRGDARMTCIKKFEEIKALVNDECE